MCSRFGSFQASKNLWKSKISCITMYYHDVMAFPIRGAKSSIYVLNNVLVEFVCVRLDVWVWVCAFVFVCLCYNTVSPVVMHKMPVLKVPYFYGLHVIKCFYTIYKNIPDTATLSVYLSHLVIPLQHGRWI